MIEVDTLLYARWVVPVQPSGLVLENHCLAIDDGRIVALVANDDAVQRYTGREVRELRHHALIPGLVNAHTHAAMNLFKGLADDLPLMEWLHGHIWPAEQRWISETFVRDGTKLAIAEMLRGGTTCFNDMYFYPDEVARVASASGIRVSLGLIVVDFPTVWASDASEYIAKGTAVHDRLRDDPLITTAFAPHAPYTVSDEPLRRIATLAEELDVPIHMHVNETADEVTKSVASHGMRPIERLERLGLLSERLLAVHMTQASDDDIARFAHHGAHVVHCPESNLKLASGYCPVDAFHAAGVNVALGTDGAASNNDLDMLAEARTAALLAKAASTSPGTLPAEHALHMATLAGARALGLDHDIGSLEVGKAADVVALDFAMVEMQPVYHPISQLIYAANRQQVSDVWVAGRQLLNTGTLTTLDAMELIKNAQQWRERIVERTPI